MTSAKRGSTDSWQTAAKAVFSAALNELLRVASISQYCGNSLDHADVTIVAVAIAPSRTARFRIESPSLAFLAL
jgi:hypothetical protein